MRVLNLVNSFSIPDTIRYRITPHGDGVIFCLWEVAPSDVREQPFLFKINQRLASREEAQELLKNYLESLRTG
ncbi:hypothetical protein OsccyDRAFT_3399 [Leptolyngbyaceae cyanobacterium JSC-12]|nr:hypothetical protein OsccyDRAFT_3399 [Leptolyngbyaceae cyanobacterium JSC-12]